MSYLAIGLCAAAVLALLLWPRKPKPVVGQVLPFHDPKRRKRFESTRDNRSA